MIFFGTFLLLGSLNSSARVEAPERSGRINNTSVAAFIIEKPTNIPDALR